LRSTAVAWSDAQAVSGSLYRGILRSRSIRGSSVVVRADFGHAVLGHGLTAASRE
jgi:hypothetical protein